MADLLGSILNSMEKPPTLGDKEKKRAKAQKEQLEKLQAKEKENLQKFKDNINARIQKFIQDSKPEKLKFEPMDKVQRTIIHEIAELACLASFSFGQDELDRYVMLWKKEFAPSDDELLAYRRGEEWSEEKAKEMAKERENDKLEEEERLKAEGSQPKKVNRAKYELLASDAVKVISTKAYGFVSSEDKKDKRSIEETLNDIRAKKKLKQEANEAQAEEDDR